MRPDGIQDESSKEEEHKVHARMLSEGYTAKPEKPARAIGGRGRAKCKPLPDGTLAKASVKKLDGMLARR